MDAEATSKVNVKQAVPFFSVSNMESSLAFYVEGLGFEMTRKWIDEGKLRWCWLELGDAAVMLQEFRKEGHDSRSPTGKVGEGVTICFFVKTHRQFTVSLFREELRRRGRLSEIACGLLQYPIPMGTSWNSKAQPMCRKRLSTQNNKQVEKTVRNSLEDRTSKHCPVWLSIVALVFAVSCARPAPPAQPPSNTPSPSPAAAMTGPPGTQPVIVGKPYPGTGVVVFINLKEGWIEINHDDIEGLMPAMQMEWTVEPKSLMNSIRVGDKVKFTVVETGKGEVITDIKTVPVTP